MEPQYPVTTTSKAMDETLFEYKGGLADDLKFLAAIPEVCDVTFLVGETREPVCAVKAILAARSRVFYKMLYDTNGKQLQHQQHSIGGSSSKRSGGLIKQLSGAASGSQNPQQQNRLRMLLKRSSEPLIQHNHQQQYQSRQQQKSPPNRNSIKNNSKMVTAGSNASTSWSKYKRGSAVGTAAISISNAASVTSPTVIIIEEFDADVFRQLVEYVHTGCVTLQPRTLLGVLNAADCYGLDELRAACTGFADTGGGITVDTACALLASAERYIHYKCTKSLVQKVLEFVDENGGRVLTLGSFTLLPQHVVRLILSRDELRADELTKFQAALMWAKKCAADAADNNNADSEDADWRSLFREHFAPIIQYHKIAASVILEEIMPLGVVPDRDLLSALAYQADPNSVRLDSITGAGDRDQLRCGRRRTRSMSVQSGGAGGDEDDMQSGCHQVSVAAGPSITSVISGLGHQPPATPTLSSGGSGGSADVVGRQNQRPPPPRRRRRPSSSVHHHHGQRPQQKHQHHHHYHPLNRHNLSSDSTNSRSCCTSDDETGDDLTSS
ncbi:serine-enriched protein-like [Myzus persicae]|uniref:serine-enriched protein-like n=1 Tax=Myzus persicae TaxID=13164 RepID=UPI000B931393|nr:serine-enriched protein-like [Myzus persicae]XP_022167805.1 serine-enriched protein-like [Myzus persicae]XP_022167806.1 serine-enriched protein-like [Myzus persicae]